MAAGQENLSFQAEVTAQDNIFNLVHERGVPCCLRGTAKQVTNAVIIREKLLYDLEFKRHRRDLIPLLYVIRDAKWFLAHRTDALLTAWPKPAQIEQGPVTGSCRYCGRPTWEHEPYCSDDCVNRARAFGIRPEINK